LAWNALAAGAAEPTKQTAPDAVDPIPDEFVEAGVCARCHVTSVVEWSISVHYEEEKSCQDCHGRSEDHVINERNEVKPDRNPRDDEIATLCARCHDEGCPESKQIDSCQTCHHSHALVDPRAERSHVRDQQAKQLEALLQRFAECDKAIEAGEAFLRSEQWSHAEKSFRAALRLRPDHRVAKQTLMFVRRRQNPAIPGFRTTTAKIDPQTGLPREVTIEDLSLPMKLVRGGEFDMGDDGLPDARPVHTVAVAPFYLGALEVTQAQWHRIMGANPSAHQGQEFPDAGNRPVDSVSWHDCIAFIDKLNQRVPGGGFRLPTEAEWEYACRADRGEIDPEPADLSVAAWYRPNTLRNPDDAKEPKETADYAPRAVGKRAPNAWGFHDMQGNVWEWCASSYRPYLTAEEEPPASGTAPSTQPGKPRATALRVLRGGGYVDSAALLRPTLRYADRPEHAFRWVGLRLARSVPPPPE